jgi:ADP-ribose pyrophosphatase YjhB (NUDIX family)
MPFTRLELVVLSLVDHSLQVLLARRAERPFAGQWALPGGALRIDEDVDLEAAALRVGEERLNVRLPFLRQVCAVGSRKRDPRAPWAVSIVYRALVPFEAFGASPGKRVETLQWRPVELAQADSRLAFDHGGLIDASVQITRSDIEALLLPREVLPATFTLGELQRICEEFLGRSIDKSSFRRKLADRDLIEPVAGQMRAGANRPAQVYRLKAPSPR